jgi:secreted Zn-dependent insulinase-like peptidase
LYEKELENYIYTVPYQMANDELQINILNNVYPNKDLLVALKLITYDDLMKFDLFNAADIININDKQKKRSISYTNKFYGLLQGNLSYDDAMKIGEYISQLNKNNGYDPADQLKNTKNEFIKIIDNKDEANSCYKLAIKIGFLRPDVTPNYVEIITCLQVLDDIINEEYFDQLRTKEQLGYIAQSYINKHGDDLIQTYTTYDFCVQSPHQNTEYLKNRTVRFIKEFREFLIADDSIEDVIESQLLQLEKPFQNLNAAIKNNYKIITSYCNNFNHKNEKKEILENMTKEQLIKFYDKYFTLKDDSYWSMKLD